MRDYLKYMLQKRVLKTENLSVITFKTGILKKKK